MEQLNIFDKILMDGVKQGIVPSMEKASREWFREEAKKLRKHQVKEHTLFRQEGHTFKNRTSIGKMYLFHYDPKHKNDASVLPYFDSLPLIFPFAPAKGGFLGMNMHYLPHNYRAKLFDSLMSVATNKRFNDNMKLKLTYDVIKGLSNTPYYQPCVKHYLAHHVRSRFLEVKPVHWNIALTLPLERFSRGGSLAPMAKAEVWRDSSRQIRENVRKR